MGKARLCKTLQHLKQLCQNCNEALKQSDTSTVTPTGHITSDNDLLWNNEWRNFIGLLLSATEFCYLAANWLQGVSTVFVQVYVPAADSGLGGPIGAPQFIRVRKGTVGGLRKGWGGVAIAGEGSGGKIWPPEEGQI